MEAMDELAELIEAAQGRTLALFSSWRGVDRARDYLSVRLTGEFPLLVQQRGDAVASLIEEFRSVASSVLLGTISLWQGVDVTGASCIQVIIDRIPFSHPDDPLASARSDAADAAGGSGFFDISVPRAATLMAQGAGRLIRSETDRGVVSVLDSRLATARYGSVIRKSMPPLWFTTDPAVVKSALGRLAVESS
jgi:ATP-dependent DNA helicase DinG